MRMAKSEGGKKIGRLEGSGSTEVSFGFSLR